MGAGASTTLECPKGDDEAKFKTIMRLFDSLDRDGNMGVQAEEAKNVANTYIEECVANLERRQVVVESELLHEHTMADQEYGRCCEASQERYKQKSAALEEEFALEIEALRIKHEANQKDAEAACKKACKMAEGRMVTRKQRASAQHGEELGAIVGKVQWYRGLKPEDRGRAFVKAVGADADGQIDFWTFYNFMKDRKM